MKRTKPDPNFRANPETLMLIANPHRRRKHHKRHHGYRRNPDFGSQISHVTSMLKPAAIGAGGALAVNYVISLLSAYLPASLTTAPMIYLTRLAGAVGLGLAARNFLSSVTANQMVEGALIVTIADAMRSQVFTPMGVNLSGTGYYSPGRIVRPGSVPKGVPTRLKGAGKFLSAYMPGNQSSRYAPMTTNGFMVR